MLNLLPAFSDLSLTAAADTSACCPLAAEFSISVISLKMHNSSQEWAIIIAHYFFVHIILHMFNQINKYVFFCFFSPTLRDLFKTSLRPTFGSRPTSWKTLTETLLPTKGFRFTNRKSSCWVTNRKAVRMNAPRPPSCLRTASNQETHQRIRKQLETEKAAHCEKSF